MGSDEEEKSCVSNLAAGKCWKGDLGYQTAEFLSVRLVCLYTGSLPSFLRGLASHYHNTKTEIEIDTLVISLAK